MPGFKFKGSDGFCRFQEIVDRTKYEMPSTVTEEWWVNNVSTQTTKIPFECCECGGRSGTTSIECFLRNCTAACWCNGGLLYSTEQGRRRLLRILGSIEKKSIAYGALASESLWKSANMKAQSQLEIVCCECGHKATPTINNFEQQRMYLCPCSIKWPFSSEEKRKRIAKCVEDLHLKPSEDFLLKLNNQKLWEEFKPGAETYVDATCLDCGISLNKTSLTRVLNLSSKGCGCTNKIEAKMYTMLLEWFSSSEFELRREFCVCKSDAGGYLRGDVGIFKEGKLCALFECDGDQHFKNSFHADEGVWEASKQRDKQKESAVVGMGCPVFRIYALHLWGANGRGNQAVCIDFLKDAVDKVLKGSSTPGVFCEPHPVYSGWAGR